MRMIINEFCEVIFVEGPKSLICKPAEIEVVEMNCLKINGKFYRRVEFLQGGMTLVEEIVNKEFDNFDTEIQCEEVYNDVY